MSAATIARRCGCFWIYCPTGCGCSARTIDTLTTRNNIAHWTGETGEAREALRLCRELLPDRTRVLGADHPETINTREWINIVQRR